MAEKDGAERSSLERVLGVITDVRAGEGVTALLMTLNVFFLLTAYYVIKPVRKGLILAVPDGAKYESYLGAAEQYARTGNPGGVAPGRTPTTTERLQDRFANIPESLPLRMMAQAAETKALLRTRSAQLTLQLQLEQDTRGTLLSAAIVQSSGNARFDDFVLEVGKSALASSAPPPQWLLHGCRVQAAGTQAWSSLVMS